MKKPKGKTLLVPEGYAYLALAEGKDPADSGEFKIFSISLALQTLTEAQARSSHMATQTVEIQSSDLLRALSRKHDVLEPDQIADLNIKFSFTTQRMSGKRHQ